MVPIWKGGCYLCFCWRDWKLGENSDSILGDGFSSAQAGLWQQRCDFLSRRTSSNWELKQERKKNWAETCENTVFPNCVHTASV